MNCKANHNLTRKAQEKIRLLVTRLKTWIFSPDENFKKSPHLFALIFFTLLIMYCSAKQCYFSLNYL